MFSVRPQGRMPASPCHCLDVTLCRVRAAVAIARFNAFGARGTVVIVSIKLQTARTAVVIVNISSYRSRESVVYN